MPAGVSARSLGDGLLENVLDAFPLLVWAMDASGRLFHVQGRALGRLGLHPGGLVGQNMFEFNASFPEILTSLNAALEGWRGRDLIRYGHRILECAYAPLRDARGAVAGVLGAARDVTEEVEAKLLLEEDRLRFRQLVENIEDVFVLTESPGNSILYLSPGFAKVWGLPPESFIGRPWPVMHLVHAEDIEKVEGFASQTPVERCGVMFRIRRPDGEERIIRCQSFPVQGTSSPGRRAWLARDVTAFRQAESRLRRLAHMLITAQEEERRRLGRELHDGLGQNLSAIRVMLEQCLDESGGGPGTAKVVGALEVIREVIAESRRLMMDLRPPMLDDLGLAATLRWLCRSLGERHPGVAVDCRIEADEDDIAPRLKLPIFRIVQEALANAARHGRPRRVEVWLLRDGARLEVSVADDGAGFDPARPRRDADAGGGYGIMGMRERAEAVQGTLRIVSPPGGGTRVEAVFPD